MSGKAFQLGLETVNAILDTLGANDFVNVVTFNDQQKVVVPCFQNKMVRATPDNIREIKSAAQAVECDNTANFTGALEMAFEMLHKVRKGN
jgi:voltage-dependent calcium channel alpha-2/delta-3